MAVVLLAILTLVTLQTYGYCNSNFQNRNSEQNRIITQKLNFERPENGRKLMLNQARMFCEKFPGSVEGLKAIEGRILTMNVTVGVNRSQFKLALDSISPISWISIKQSNYTSPESDTEQVDPNSLEVQVLTNQGKIYGTIKSDIFSAVPNNEIRIRFILAHHSPRNVA